MKINENKIISAISKGLKQALNEISDDTIRAAADKAKRLKYDNYYQKMNSYLESDWKVFKKFAFPEDSMYILLVENKHNTHEISNYKIIIGVTDSLYNKIHQTTINIDITLSDSITESFVESAEEIHDINLVNNKKYDVNCAFSAYSEDIDIRDHFDVFTFYTYNEHVDKWIKKDINYPGIEYVGIQWLPTNKKTVTKFNGLFTFKKIMKKIVPAFNKYTGFSINYKNLIPEETIWKK